MINVYEAVRLFFEDELTEPSIVARDWVEGFLRQKAWSGTSDADLHDIWKQLRALLVYLSYTHHQMLDEMAAEDYADAIRWLNFNSMGFKATLKNVRRFFAAVIEFHQYLIGRKLIVSSDEVQSAAEQIAGGKRLNLFTHHQSGESDGLSSDSLADSASMPQDEVGALPGSIEKLMLKVGSYFQRESFDEDFHRALYLYVGPLQAIPASEEEGFSDFWIGFWDYFLFDYHLRQDDLTPVGHYLQGKHRISAAEKTLLNDLSAARFTVFYVERIVDQEWVECVNLLTGDVFRMPNPDFDYKALKRLLFFGHVFAHGSFVANYVASIEVSANLRRRVKQEVLKLKNLFSAQQPDASWDDFLIRHCLAVRHTITLLTSFAKLNVTTGSEARSRRFSPVTDTSQPDERVTEELQRLMPNYGFSLYDVKLAKTIWTDYSRLESVRMRKSGGWTAAIISCYALLNTPFSISVEDLAEEVGVSPSSIYANRRRIADALDIQPQDPRYLSEEGILMLLYSS